MEGPKLYNTQKKLFIMALVTTFFAGIFAFLPLSEAHILIIGDSQSDYPQAYTETSALAKVLKSKGYDVVALYGKNATSKNILKGMYGADAVIYDGHGGYQSGNYNMNGGNAIPPFAIVGSDNFIWGIGDQMREGWNGKLFAAPFKKDIPVIVLHACFSTGWVGDTEVANPTETIYDFASMFTGAGANYYASGWDGAEIVYDLMGGTTSFAEANNKNYEKISTSTSYNGVQVWRNNNGHAVFIGDWNAKFPTVAETTAYNDTAAENWYDTNVINTNVKPVIKPDLIITKAYKSGNYLYITVKNQGKSTSGACYTRAWYGSYYKNIYTSSLKPGSYKTYKVYFKCLTPNIRTFS